MLKDLDVVRTLGTKMRDIFCFAIVLNLISCSSTGTEQARPHRTVDYMGEHDLVPEFLAVDESPVEEDVGPNPEIPQGPLDPGFSVDEVSIWESQGEDESAVTRETIVEIQETPGDHGVLDVVELGDNGGCMPFDLGIMTDAQPADAAGDSQNQPLDLGAQESVVGEGVQGETFDSATLDSGADDSAQAEVAQSDAQAEDDGAQEQEMAEPDVASVEEYADTPPDAEGPCEPNPCNEPPNPFCKDGLTLVLYAQVGQCEVVDGQAVCSYDFSLVDCSELGLACREGACVLISEPCPSDMALIEGPDGHRFCMDIYEASRADATATSVGTSDVATSRPGVMPWYANPMSLAALAQFMAGCQNAGKRLCTKEEWFEACNGPNDTIYFFGNQWNQEVCNSVDTFCDDYCAANNISPCNTNENCGYTYYCFHIMPTGSFQNCTNEYGLYDVNGNVWEVVPADTPRGYEVRGGAFNCAYPSVRFRCDFNATWDSLYAGFRCCKDAE